MKDKIGYLLNRLKERLWFKPLIMCLLSITGVFVAKFADDYQLDDIVPDVSTDSLETLLDILSSSMLMIAVFAVGSMIAAYTSASNQATPRSFPLIVADDVSQNALSAFIGAFIFSVVAQLALDYSYYDDAGRFALMILTLAVFIIVIMTFVRWVDRIARLGRMGTTVDKVKMAAINALNRRIKVPALGGVPMISTAHYGQPFYSDKIGYVKRIDMKTLQNLAEKSNIKIQVAALPGTFVTPAHPIAYADIDVYSDTDSDVELDIGSLRDAFLIGNDRSFDEDPRFGLIVLSQIASRALSPAVNDPGTAIVVIGALVHVLSQRTDNKEISTILYDRVIVPEISVTDMFDDAFSAIARDGASLIEVVVRLQKSLEILAIMGDSAMHDAAIAQAKQALVRAELALQLPADIALAKKTASFYRSDPEV